MIPFLVQEALKKTTRRGPPKSLPLLPYSSIKEFLELHPGQPHNPPIPQFQHPRTKANTRWKEMRYKITPHYPANLLPWAIYNDEFLVTPDASLPPWATVRQGLPIPIPLPSLMRLLPQKLFQIPPRHRSGGKYLLAYLLGIAPQYLDMLDPEWPHRAMLALRAYCATPNLKLLLAWVNPLHIARSPQDAQTLIAIYEGRLNDADRRTTIRLSSSPIVKAALTNPDYPRHNAPRPQLKAPSTFPSLRAKEEYALAHKPMWLYLRNIRMKEALNPRTRSLSPPAFFRANILPPTRAFLESTKKEAQRSKAIWKEWASPKPDDILMTRPLAHSESNHV